MMENINVSTPNDGLGDPLRNAFVKVNLNFTELDNGKEVKLLASDSTKYYKGDKSWQTLNKTAVGLNLVDNTADSNKPVSIHQQLALDSLNSLKEDKANKNIANGYAGLDSSGKIIPTQLPALAISETYPVSSQTEMLALSQAEQGDVAIRSDISKSYILRTSPSSVLSNWSELLSPTNAVRSVNGQTGVVNLTKSMVGLGNVDNTSDLSKPISTATQTALNGKEPIIPTGTALQYIKGDKTLGTFPTIPTVDNIPTDGSNNAVSSNGVFDALATKAPISSVHNPVTLGTANGLSLSTQQLSLGLASSGVTGALSGTDWNTFNGKFNTPTGLTTNYLPKWNGSGFGNSQIFDNGTNVGIGTTTPTEKLDVVGACRFVTASLGVADGTTNYYVAKPLGSIGDFATSVILLHPVYTGTLITHYECNGTITVRRGSSYAGLNTGSISINSSTAYNNNIYNVSYINTHSNIYKLVTCDFGGVKYLALRADLSAEAQAKSFFFDGYSQGDSNALQIKAIGAVTNVVVVSSNGQRELEGLTVSGNIISSPAILSNHVVVKSQLDALASSGTYTPSNQTNAAQTVNFIRSYWERKGNVLTVTTSLTYTVTQIQNTASFLITLPNGFLVSGANGRIIGSSLLHTTQGIFNNNANMKAYESLDSSQINLQANFQATVSSGTYETIIIYTVLIQ